METEIQRIASELNDTPTVDTFNILLKAYDKSAKAKGELSAKIAINSMLENELIEYCEFKDKIAKKLLEEMRALNLYYEATIGRLTELNYSYTIITTEVLGIKEYLY